MHTYVLIRKPYLLCYNIANFNENCFGAYKIATKTIKKCNNDEGFKEFDQNLCSKKRHQHEHEIIDNITKKRQNAPLFISFCSLTGTRTLINIIELIPTDSIIEFRLEFHESKFRNLYRFNFPSTQSKT